MTFKRIYLLIFVSLLFASCEKDDLTKPTKVVVGVKLQNKDGFYVSADSGSMFVSNFEFAGVREVGPGVFFNTGLDSSVNVPLIKEVSTKVQEFDIPIGFYTKITTKLSVLFDSNVERNKMPRLKVIGTFRSKNETTVPFVFISMIERVLQLDGSNASGGNVVLSLGVTSNADYILHTEDLFGDVSQETMDGAEISMVSGVRTVVISESSNKEIYKKVVSRIDRSFELLFNTTN